MYVKINSITYRLHNFIYGGVNRANMGRLSENSNDTKFSPTYNEETGVELLIHTHFCVKNSIKNGIESHWPLVFGQPVRGVLIIRLLG